MAVKERDPNLRPYVYEDNGTIVYRASTIGDCLTSLVASRLGEHPTPPPGYMKDIFAASSTREDEAIDLYKVRTGHYVIWQQKETTLHVGTNPPNGKIVIRGHIDGLDQNTDDVLEVKWLSGRNFDLYNTGGLDGLGMLGMKYRWQAAVYGHSLDRLVRFVIGNKDSTGDDEGDLLIIEPSVHPNDLVPLDDIYARVVEVENYAAMDELPPCDRKCSTSSFFAHVHFFESEAGSIADDDLAGLVHEFYKLKFMLDGDPTDKEDGGLNGQLKELGDRIKEQTLPGKYQAGPLVAQVVRKHMTKFNRARFKRDHPELDEQYTEPAPDQIQLIVRPTSKTPKGVDSIVL